MDFEDMDRKELIKGEVFLDAASRPYLAANGWLHYWHPEGKWVTLRELKAFEFADRILNPEEAAMYGVDSNNEAQ